jgi:ATP synthase protein I
MLCAVIGLVSAAVSLVAVGAPGLVGSLIGAGLVVGFFGLGHLVLTRLRDIEAPMFFLIAMLTYVLQVICLLAVFGSFASWSDGVSATALGLTIVACTLAWTTGLVVASRRQRIPLFDLGGQPR